MSLNREHSRSSWALKLTAFDLAAVRNSGSLDSIRLIGTACLRVSFAFQLP